MSEKRKRNESRVVTRSSKVPRLAKNENTKQQRVHDWINTLSVQTASDGSEEESSEIEEEHSEEDDTSEVLTEETERPKRSRASNRRSTRYKNVTLNLQCEWGECKFRCSHDEQFVKHVSGHLPYVENKENEDKGVLYLCLWDSCGFDSHDQLEVIRHINYHSYHTRLKTYGQAIIDRLKLPTCTLDYAGRNLLPVLSSEFKCDWDDCDTYFNNIQMFFYHVKSHVTYLRGEKVTDKYKCRWRHCSVVSHHLKNHIRTHVQEKVVGCPTCGGLFSYEFRFEDHCYINSSNKRRKLYKCSQCTKGFPTERLLKGHARTHINRYECPMCPMTCKAPSVLSKHIRYRHLDTRPFQCNFCEHRSKTKIDLENHQLTHCSENFWVCEKEDCDYSCRSKYALQQHYSQVHGKKSDRLLYRCHICPKRYQRGYQLTTHLKCHHKFVLGTGSSKFRYVKDDRGYFVLKNHRIDCLKITDEMIKLQDVCVADTISRNYDIKVISPDKIAIVCSDKTNKKVAGKERSEKYVEKVQKDKENQNEDGKSDDESEKQEDKEKKKEDESNGESEDGETGNDNSSDFGGKLKKYLGLVDKSHFVEIVRNDEG